MYRLPQECLERLSCSLENGPSVDWNVLATEGFGSIYSDDLKLAKIKSSPRPAWGLLWDLCSRDIRVETLLQALKSIGNERAISIILEEVPELRKSCLDREISPPPGIRSRQPEENNWEEAATLRRPVQESGIGNRKPSSHLVRNTTLMDMISTIFPCFGYFNHFY